MNPEEVEHDLGGCPFYARAMGLTGHDPEGICFQMGACSAAGEPLCITCEPEDGWATAPVATPEVIVPDAVLGPGSGVPRGTSDEPDGRLPVIGGPAHGSRWVPNGSIVSAGYGLAHIGLADPADDDLVHVVLVWLPDDPSGRLDGYGWLVGCWALLAALAGFPLIDRADPLP